MCAARPSTPGAGRVETNTRYEPSGAIEGCSSFHWPENEAISGMVHCCLTRWDSRMVPAPAPLRVNSSRCPSRVNVGEPSLAGPEITPGANNSGVPAEDSASVGGVVRDASTPTERQRLNRATQGLLPPALAFLCMVLLPP